MPEFKHWLVKRNDKSFCKICYVTIHGNLAHLKRHITNKTHKRKMAVPDTPSVREALQNDEFVSLQKNVRSAEIKMCMYVAQRSLPISIMDDLPDLVRALSIDPRVPKNINQ